MRSRLLPALLAAVILTLLAGPGSAGAATGRRLYLSLGDSLTVGRQPDASGRDHNTPNGYVEVVARGIARKVGPVRALKLGCGGTTSSALYGRSCNGAYGPGSQVQQAERILRAQRARTALVTVEIGDNDVEDCLGPTFIDRTCFDSGLARMTRNLRSIASRLRSAAGRHVPIVGVADYDQFLAYWLSGGRRRRIAVASVRFVSKLNATMRAVYAHRGVRVADAAGRFSTRVLNRYVSLSGHGRVPLAVARICQWTWSCAAPPRGPDSHAKSSGYRVLALTVLSALRGAYTTTSGGASPG